MADEPNPTLVQAVAPNRGQPQAAQAQRREERPGGAAANPARGRDLAEQRKAENEKLRADRANRPQQVGDEGQKPTPTQDENDKIRAGEMHLDDKEDDGSGPDVQFALRRVDAGSKDGGYETR